MSRVRRILVVLFLAAPFAALFAAGLWSLLETRRLFWLGWLFPLFFAAAWLAARKRSGAPEHPPELDATAPAHWTPQDRAAGRLVDARIRAVGEIPVAQLAEPRFHLDAGIDLAQEIARHYHPRAKDPIGPLRAPEIIAALNLAFEELEQRALEYVPGSHLLTIDQWRMLARSPDWIDAASKVSRVASILVHPLNLGRVLLTEGAARPLTKRLQQNVLAGLHAILLRELGYYLIEMHSGRLRAGSVRYRELMRRRADGSEHDDPSVVTVGLVGQVGAGKSSLVQALTGGRESETDLMPRTRGVRRHRLELADTTFRVELLDTAGYGAQGATDAERDDARRAWLAADLVLLVMDVRSPARKGDLELAREVAAELEADPRRKPAPVLGVLTHVDQLSPVLEWAPPYSWERPELPKEESMRQAVEYVQGVFGPTLAGVVPVCAAVEAGRVYGVQEWLLPAMTALLDEAHASSLVRVLRAEESRGRVERVVRQLANAGRALLGASVRGSRARKAKSGAFDARRSGREL